MNKRILSMLIMAVIIFSLTIPAWADNTTSGDQSTATPTPTPVATVAPTPIPAVTPAPSVTPTITVSPNPTPVPNSTKNNKDQLKPNQKDNQKNTKIDAQKAKANNERLTKLQDQIKKLQNDMITMKSRIKDAIDKAKADLLKKVQNKQDNSSNAKSILQNLQQSLDKLAADQKKELDNYKSDIATQTDNMNKNKAALQKQLTEIDTNLQKQTTDLNARIAAATNADTKQKLQNLLLIEQKYRDAQKTLINKYLADLIIFWADKQKFLDERIALLVHNQKLEMDFRIASVNLRKNELEQTNANTPQEAVKTDAQIEKEVNYKAQVNIDKLNKQIKELTDQLNLLKSK
jgi:hypothetical protein